MDVNMEDCLEINITEEQLVALREWISTFPFWKEEKKQFRSFTRDFSDGHRVARMCKVLSLYM